MNLVVIIIALFGVEILLHRRYIHELNRLISTISLLQAEIELRKTSDSQRFAEQVFGLEVCSDLLSLISTIGGYYRQEDAGLVFSGLTGMVHARANSIKLNIRLKLLSAGSGPLGAKTHVSESGARGADG